VADVKDGQQDREILLGTVKEGHRVDVEQQPVTDRGLHDPLVMQA
jgi:hypothetical protein